MSIYTSGHKPTLIEFAALTYFSIILDIQTNEHLVEISDELNIPNLQTKKNLSNLNLNTKYVILQ